MLQTNIALSVVLPAYEEAANLKILLPRLNESLAAMGISYEVLVIDTVCAPGRDGGDLRGPRHSLHQPLAFE